ncbi:MAG: FHA domain-containing protein, partial [Sandaracinaceae bacterium]
MTIEMGGGAVETLTVPAIGPVVIGRDASCHVVLPSPDVSRRHLTVELVGGHGYRLTDASANGTMIGESHLHQATVDAPGGIPMRVGPYVIRLAPLAEPARPIMAAPPAEVREPPPPGVSAPAPPKHRSV